jgi:hypothetical protein
MLAVYGERMKRTHECNPAWHQSQTRTLPQVDYSPIREVCNLDLNVLNSAKKLTDCNRNLSTLSPEEVIRESQQKW